MITWAASVLSEVRLDLLNDGVDWGRTIIGVRGRVRIRVRVVIPVVVMMVMVVFISVAVTCLQLTLLGHIFNKVDCNHFVELSLLALTHH